MQENESYTLCMCFRHVRAALLIALLVTSSSWGWGCELECQSSMVRPACCGGIRSATASAVAQPARMATVQSHCQHAAGTPEQSIVKLNPSTWSATESFRPCDQALAPVLLSNGAPCSGIDRAQLSTASSTALHVLSIRFSSAQQQGSHPTTASPASHRLPLRV